MKRYFKIYWLGVAVVVAGYFYLSLCAPLRIGLVSGEFNMNVVSFSYPLAVLRIQEQNGNLENIYAVPVEGAFSEAVINNIGLFETVKAFIDPVYSIRFLNKLFPVMKNAYTGALTYYYAWFFSFLGNDRIFSVHFANIFLGGAIILLTFYLAYLIFGKTAAFTCLLLLSTNPLFIVFKRLPAFPEHFNELFSIVILVTLFLFHKTGKNRYLNLTAFFAGFAIYQKIIFAWTLASLFITFMAFRPNLNINFKQLNRAIFFFLFGVSLFLFYNIISQDALNLATSVLLNKAFSQRLIPRISEWFQRFAFMFGDPLGFFYYLFYGSRIPRVNYFPGAVLSLSLLFPFFNAFKKKPWIEKRKAVFFPVFIVALLFTMSIINLGRGFSFPHAFLLVPFVVISESCFLVYLPAIFRNISKKHFRLSGENVSLLLAVLVAVFQVFQVLVYYSWENNDKGPVVSMVRVHRELAEYLQEKKIVQPFTTSFNLMGIMEFLSENKVRPLHYWIFWKNSDSKREALKQILLKNKRGFYIYKAGYRFDIFSAFAEPAKSNFLEISAENGIQPYPVKHFYTGNGEVMYSLYELRTKD